MSDVRAKYIEPSVNALAFNCPHCGALAKQLWHALAADPYLRDKTPRIISKTAAKSADLSSVKKDEQQAARERLLRLASRAPFLRDDYGSRNFGVDNLWVARCFNCDELSVWVYDAMIYPAAHEAPLPNADLSADVLRDYREAGSIVGKSPRGAAALLRLAIQKLCAELGGAGKNINDDIAYLVKNGLDKRVQRALDVVRVVGNNAVHPGMIDLRDDRATAEKLFGLVNIIADIMISQPKHIEGMFNDLPEAARSAIQKRDS